MPPSADGEGRNHAVAPRRHQQLDSGHGHALHQNRRALDLDLAKTAVRRAHVVGGGQIEHHGAQLALVQQRRGGQLERERRAQLVERPRRVILAHGHASFHDRYAGTAQQLLGFVLGE